MRRRLRPWTCRTSLWIGGGAGERQDVDRSRRSRERFELQLYNVDHRTWVHEARMPPTEFASLSMDERWVEATPDADAAVVRRRPRGTVSGSCSRICAGCPTTPARDRRRAAALPDLGLGGARSARPGALPDARSRRSSCSGCSRAARCPGPRTACARGRTPPTRDVLIAELIAREARELRLTVLPVDRPLDEMIELRCRPLRRRRSSAARAVDLAAIRRFENEVIATQVRLYRESLAPLELPDEPLSFACECDAPDARRRSS